MILNWKKQGGGILVLPVMKKAEDNTLFVEKNIRLLPGFNEVSEADLAGIKLGDPIHMKPDSEDVILLEVVIETVEKTDEKTGKTSSKKQEVVFKDLKAKQARKVVEDTWDVDTLKGWLEEEGRDEIRASIQNQLERIDKGE